MTKLPGPQARKLAKHLKVKAASTRIGSNGYPNESHKNTSKKFLELPKKPY
jgi:hypothetical protein